MSKMFHQYTYNLWHLINRDIMRDYNATEYMYLRAHS